MLPTQVNKSKSSRRAAARSAPVQRTPLLYFYPFRLLPLVLLLAILSACAPGEAPPAAICDTYSRALFTTQLMGGASVLLGLAILGFRKNISAILPSQGAQVGAVAGSVFLGLILLAFSTDIGNQILTGFSIESMYTLCGLG